MTDYKAIFGKKIKFLTSDLSAAEAEGEIFYSDTDSDFKVAIASGAWAAAAPLNTGRSPVNCGTQTAALAVSGPTSAPSNGTQVEEYNGSGWTEGPDVNTARRYIGISTNGSVTAAVAAGGDTTTGGTGQTAVSEEWNGTSWTEGPDLNTAREVGGGAGTQTAGLVMTGKTTAYSTATEEYDGTNWTTVNNYPSEKVGDAASCGIQTAAMVATGWDGAVRAYVNEYDGTNWASATAYPSARYALGLFGIQTSAIGAGGNASPNTLANSYDGTSWTAVGSLGTGRQLAFDAAAGASSAAGVVCGSDTRVTTCEEYNFTAMTVAASAWASGGNPNTARSAVGGAGTQTAGLMFGGNRLSPPSPQVAITESYDGSAWTEVADLDTGRSDIAHFGTQTAAMCVAGVKSPDTNAGEAETWDGSSWTEGTDVNQTRRGARGAGTSTAGLVFGGQPGGSGAGPPNYGDESEEWDGSSWTEGSNLNTKRKNLVGFGTQTAAVGAGGYGDEIPGPSKANAEEYDGSSWTNVTDMSSARRYLAGCGTQTAGLIYGGNVPPFSTATEGYDGTSWSTRPVMATARSGLAPATSASNTAALGASGYPGGAVEEYSEDVTSLNLKTITDS